MNKTAKDALDDFYSNNIKLGYDDSKHDILASSLRKEEAETLAFIIDTYKPSDTLEIGLAMGASAVAIAASKVGRSISEPHVVLDPYQNSRAKDAGLIELKRLGFKNAISFYPRFSEDFLNECYKGGQQFDFIFIDGYHTIGQTVTDVFLSDKILKKNGIIALHDSLLTSSAVAIKYLMRERGYKVILDRTLSLRTILRMMRYSNKLGLSYACQVIPRIRTSVAALQKS